WPWMDEGGEYKWWEFWSRPSMSMNELRAVENNVPSAQLATLCFRVNDQTLKNKTEEIEGISLYAVTEDFDRLQNIEIAHGRYLSVADIDGGTNTVVLGDEVYQQLFPGNRDPTGSVISLKGKK